MLEDEADFEMSVHCGLSVISSDDIEQKILSPLSCLREYESKWVLEFDLPLVEKENVSVILDPDNKITVEAKLREKFCVSNLYEECEFDYFKKSVSVPENIDHTKIYAKFFQGRLIVSLPKISKGHSIRID